MPSQSAKAVNYAMAPLQPRYNGLHARANPVNLQPSTVFPSGQVLVYAGVAQNDVQLLTLTGVPTGGTITLAGTNPLTSLNFVTAPIAFNATSATVQATLTASNVFGPGNATVSGSAGGPWTVTFAGNLAGVPVPIMVLGTNALTGGTTPSLTIAHSTIGRTAGTYAPYTGSGTAVAFLKYACQTDAAGQISYSTTNATGEWGQTSEANIAYFAGVFNTADLVGLDANAVTTLVGRLWSGTIAAGELSIF